MGRILGPSFDKDRVPDAVAAIVGLYLHRRKPDKSFGDALACLGVDAFKRELYASADAQADSDGKVVRIQVFAFTLAVMEDLPMPCLQLKTGESMPEPDILQSLSDSDVVAVYFEKFFDGWGFSLGRQLRGSLSCDHPLVANGHIIPDQADYLRRVGLSHAVIVAEAPPQWQKSLVEVMHCFQALDTSPRTRSGPKR